MMRLNLDRYKHDTPLWLLIGTPLVGLIAISVFLWFDTDQVQVRVMLQEWHWDISVQRWQPVRYEREYGWPPEGSYDTRTWIETDTRTVRDSNGRERIEKDDTRYCNYTMDEWVHNRYLSAHGTDLEPHWPVTKGKFNNQSQRINNPRHGDERLGKRRKLFWLHLKEENGERKWKFEINNQVMWKKALVDEIHEAEVNHFDSIRGFRLLPQTDRIPLELRGGK